MRNAEPPAQSSGSQHQFFRKASCNRAHAVLPDLVHGQPPRDSHPRIQLRETIYVTESSAVTCSAADQPRTELGPDTFFSSLLGFANLLLQLRYVRRLGVIQLAVPEDVREFIRQLPELSRPGRRNPVAKINP